MARKILLLPLLASLPALGQVAAPTCVVNAGVPPVIRAEGRTELVGDLVVSCRGFAPAGLGEPIPTVNVQIFLNTTVTSRKLAGDWTEALLLLDEPAPGAQFPCQTLSGICPARSNETGAPTYYGPGQPGTPGNNKNVYQGQATSARNVIVWNAIPLDGPERTLRITNVRIDASMLGVSGTLIPAQAMAFLSISGGRTVSVTNPQQVVGFISRGAEFSLRDPAGNPRTGAIELSGCGASSPVRIATVRFQELFATAFRRRTVATGDTLGALPPPSDQNTPGQVVNSESGFYSARLVGHPERGDLARAGLADHGSRLIARFSNIPIGMNLYVDVTNIGADTQNAARLVSPPASTASPAPLEIRNGTAEAVWEIANSNATASSAFLFALYATHPRPGPFNTPPSMQVSGGLGPFAPAVGTAVPPIPHFSDPPPSTTVAFSVPPCTGTLAVTPDSLIFRATSNGPAPAAQFVQVFGSDTLQFTVARSTASGGNWLDVTPLSGVTPAQLRVSVNPANLQQGSYSATVIVSSPGQSRSVSVTLEISDPGDSPPELAVDVAQIIYFDYDLRRPLVLPRPVSLTINTNGGAPVAITISTEVVTPVRSNWIQVVPPVATAPTTATVTVNPTGLNPGRYLALISFTPQVAVALSSRRIPETGEVKTAAILNVTGAAGPGGTLTMRPQRLDFPGVVPGPQELAINNFVADNPAPASFSPSVRVLEDILWLSINPTADGLTPARLMSTSTPTGLPSRPEPYLGFVTASNPNTAATSEIYFNVSGAGGQSPPNAALSQVADGDGWRTTITLVNPTTSEADFTLRFWSSNGSAWLVPLEGQAPVQELTSRIPPLGSRSYATAGLAANVSQGWAEVTSAAPIEGLAIFRRQLAGFPDREAAVRLRASSSRNFIVPFDNSGGFETSMAIINPDSQQDANISAKFRDRSGNVTGPDVSFTLPAKGHRAFSLLSDSLFAGETAGRTGTVEWSSSNPVMIGLGLRFDPQRLFTSFATLPVAEPAQPSARRVITQIAARSNWKTTITLVNNGTARGQFTLRFRGQDGNPMQVAIEGRGSVTTVSDEIPGGGSYLLSTADAPAEALLQGSAELESTVPIEGLAVFRQSVTGRDREGAVPFDSAGSASLLMPFDNRNQFVTSVALVNDSAQPATVTATFRSIDGVPIQSVTLPNPIPPRGHTAFETTTGIFGNLNGQRGVVEFSAPGATLLGIGLRFDPSGLFTTLPTIRR